MPKKDKQTDTPKTPRTVQELAPWLNLQLGFLAESIRNQAPFAAGANHQIAAPASREAVVHQLAACSHQLTSLLELYLTECSKPALASTVTLSDLARALILSKNGEHFEPAIQSAVRVYADTCDEQHRVSNQPGLSEEVRKDILAGFTKIAAHQEQDLRVLGVEHEHVSSGVALDLDVHDVVTPLRADNEKQLNTVCQGITPIFRWQNAHGKTSIEPARVTAFTELKTPAPPAQEAKRPSPSSPPAKDAAAELPTVATALESSNLFQS